MSRISFISMGPEPIGTAFVWMRTFSFLSRWVKVVTSTKTNACAWHFWHMTKKTAWLPSGFGPEPVASTNMKSSANSELQYGHLEVLRRWMMSCLRSLKDKAERSGAFLIIKRELQVGFALRDHHSDFQKFFNVFFSLSKAVFLPSAQRTSKTPGENCSPVSATRVGHRTWPFLSPSFATTSVSRAFRAS